MRLHIVVNIYIYSTWEAWRGKTINLGFGLQWQDPSFGEGGGMRRRSSSSLEQSMEAFFLKCHWEHLTRQYPQSFWQVSCVRHSKWKGTGLMNSESKYFFFSPVLEFEPRTLWIQYQLSYIPRVFGCIHTHTHTQNRACIILKFWSTAVWHSTFQKNVGKQLFEKFTNMFSCVLFSHKQLFNLHS